MTDVQKDIIVALCRANMNISEAARTIPCHRNNVMYHIGRIREQTGLDPMNFFDLFKLHWEAKNETETKE